MTIQSFVKILKFFSYILKFSLIASDITSHIARLVEKPLTSTELSGTLNNLLVPVIF